MNKIEVGMYVRIKDSGIDKITSIYNNEVRFREKPIFSDGECIGYKWCYKKDIVKASYNIIDLIEEGDYVNGYLVLNILDSNDNAHILSLEKIYNSSITEEEIKSIVTKEQFERMEYKVE